MRVAIMQPYFFPYAGYFRLLAAADLFVVYDCVQFPRRGWVHRNRVTDSKGELSWITLPLTPASFTARIAEMRLAADARTRMEKQIPRFPLLRGAPHDRLQSALGWEALEDGAPMTDYLQHTLAASAAALGIAVPMLRSSMLAIPEGVPREQRILEICRRVGATAYVNAPGGTALYDAETFRASGVSLAFLPPWQGSFASILEPLLTDAAAAAGTEIRQQSTT